VVIAKQLVDIDFELIILPLLSVGSISDYLELFLGPRLFDVQPVRDLSLLLDIKLSALIGHQTFGLTNLMIWIGSCFVSDRLLKELGVDEKYRWLVFLVLIHPIVSWTIYWPAARKHLLSVLFIQLATLKGFQFFKGDSSKGVWILLFYFLSIFSQPINVMWAFVFLIFLGRRSLEMKNVPFVALLLITMLIGLGSNYSYYKFLYPNYAGLIPGLFTFNFNFSLLSISRGFTQIFFPVSFSQDYSYNSWLNLLGLPLFIILFTYSWAKLRWVAFIVGLLIVHPLLLVGTRGGSILTNDTYLVSSLLGICLLIVLVMQRMSFNIKWLMALVPVLGIKAGLEIRNTTNPLRFQTVSYQNEPNCRNALSLSHELLIANDVEEFLRVSGIALNNECLIIGGASSALMNQTYAIRLLLSDALDDETLLKTIDQLLVKTPIVRFLQQAMRAKLGLKVDAEEIKHLKMIIDPRFKPILTRLILKHLPKLEIFRL